MSAWERWWGILRRLPARLRTVRAEFGYVVRLVFPLAPVAAVVLLLQGILGGLSTPLLVWAMAGLINALTLVQRAPTDPWTPALPWLAALLVATLLRSLPPAIGGYAAALLRERVNAALQRRILEQSVALPLAMFDRSELYAKLDAGRIALQSPLVDALWDLNVLVATLVAAAGLLVLFLQASLLLVLVLVATIAARAVLSARWAGIYTTTQRGNLPSRREADYWAGLLTSRGAAPELRLYGLAGALERRWRRAYDRYQEAVISGRRRMFALEAGSTAVQEAVSWLSVLVLLLLALAGSVNLGSLVALLYGISRYRSLAWEISGSIGRLVERWAPVTYLREFLALPTGSGSVGPGSWGDGAPPPPLRQSVQCRQVSFTYPGADRPALQRIDLTLRAGEHVALVGENGAGKTTLVKVLLGLYRPTEGHITVDGVDLTDIDPAVWRRQATAIFQDFVRYPTTALENIAYADVALLADERFLERPAPPRVVAAALESGADGVVAALPHGYATLLGKEFAGAADLSAGQWQRLALARAYLRDAQLVVLDEPTAALDPRGEAAVYEQFAAAAAGRCAVFISHRLGSARLADRIVVLRAGRVVEEGTHDDLLVQKGEYARMFQLQAAWYQPESDGQAERLPRRDEGA